MSSTPPKPPVKVELLGDLAAFASTQRVLSDKFAIAMAPMLQTIEKQTRLSDIFAKQIGLETQKFAVIHMLKDFSPQFMGKSSVAGALLAAQRPSLIGNSIEFAQLAKLTGPAARLGMTLSAAISPAIAQPSAVQSIRSILPELLADLDAAAEADELPVDAEERRPATSYAELLVVLAMVYPLAALILEESAKQRLNVTAATAIAVAIFIVVREVTRRQG